MTAVGRKKCRRFLPYHGLGESGELNFYCSLYSAGMLQGKKKKSQVFKVEILRSKILPVT